MFGRVPLRRMDGSTSARPDRVYLILIWVSEKDWKTMGRSYLCVVGCDGGRDTYIAFAAADAFVRARPA